MTIGFDSSQFGIIDTLSGDFFSKAKTSRAQQEDVGERLDTARKVSGADVAMGADEVKTTQVIYRKSI